jgi:hypothetical protein
MRDGMPESRAEIEPQLPLGARSYQTDAALRPQPRRSGPDLWPTPPSLIRALINHVVPRLPDGPIWECAAGQGDLAAALGNAGRQVIASDLHGGRSVDFLQSDPPARPLAAIVTNPPFFALDAFIARGLRHLDEDAAESLVLLVRDDALMAGGRAAALNRAAFMLGCSWRARWIADSTQSPRWAFTWIVWHAGSGGPPVTVRVRSGEGRTP